jgi:hypothetical protein
MTKSFFFVIITIIVFFIGFTIYRSLPQITSTLKQNKLFPHIQRLLEVTPTPNPSSSLSNSPQIKNYLATNIAITSHAGKVVCEYSIFNPTQPQPTTLYLYVLCQEYYTSQQKILAGSGLQLPVVLKLTWQTDQFQITGFAVPGLGSNYAPDVTTLFPAEIATSILSDSITTQAATLQKQAQEKSQKLIY